MIFRLCFFLICAACTLSPISVSAAPIYFTGLNSGYSPGTTQVFEVGLPSITNLGSYNIDVVLTGNLGIAGTDFFFDVPATTPSASGYVFTTAANFFAAANNDSALSTRLTLTDFDFAGTDVVPGVNDRVATISIRTLPSFQGTLSLAVDAASLFLDTPEVVPTPVSELQSIVNSVAAAQPELLLPVPEPTGLTLLGLSFLLLSTQFRPTKC